MVDRSTAESDGELDERVAGLARRAYWRVVADPGFETGVAVLVGLYAVVAAVAGGFALTRLGATTSVGFDVPSAAQATSSIVGAALVLRGALVVRSNRLLAYRWFARGLVVWILVTQPFVFYASQLAGVGGLAFDLVAYVTVRYAIGRERVAASPKESPPAPGAS